MASAKSALDNSDRAPGSAIAGDRGVEVANLILRLAVLDGPCGECDARLTAVENGWSIIDAKEGEFINFARSDGTPFTARCHEGRYGFLRYTGSFDHARGLLPKGCYWHTGEGKTRDDEPLGAASIIEPGSLETVAEAEHASFIIAFCIACLQARAALAKARAA